MKNVSKILTIVSKVLTIIAFAVCIINILFFTVVYLMNNYIAAWGYVTSGALWEKACEGIYDNIIVGILGGEVIAPFILIVLTANMLVLSAAPITYNIMSKLKKMTVVSFCAAFLLLVQVIFLARYIMDVFASI